MKLETISKLLVLIVRHMGLDNSDCKISHQFTPYPQHKCRVVSYIRKLIYSLSKQFFSDNSRNSNISKIILGSIIDALKFPIFVPA